MSKIRIEVAKVDGLKCPRCWHIAGVESNPEHLCDRCLITLLQDLDYFVSVGAFTPEEAVIFRQQACEAAAKWEKK